MQAEGLNIHGDYLHHIPNVWMWVRLQFMRLVSWIGKMRLRRRTLESTSAVVATQVGLKSRVGHARCGPLARLDGGLAGERFEHVQHNVHDSSKQLRSHVEDTTGGDPD